MYLSLGVFAVAIAAAAWSARQHQAEANAGSPPGQVAVEGISGAAAKIASLVATNDVVLVVVRDTAGLDSGLEARVTTLVQKINDRGKRVATVTLDPDEDGYETWLKRNAIASLPSVVMAGAGCGAPVTLSGDLSEKALAEAYAGVSTVKCDSPCDTPCDKPAPDSPCNKSEGA